MMDEQPTAKIQTPTPDYAEPLLGWRIWRVRGNLLHSAVVRAQEPWEPYQAKMAKHAGICFATNRHWMDETDGTALVSDVSDRCRCGIYAFRTAVDLALDVDLPGPDQPFVLGQIALWGTVAVHARGYRASHAYPARLVYAEGCDGASIAAAYGIPYQEDPSWTSVSSNIRSLSSRFGSPFQSSGPMTTVPQYRVTRLWPPPSRQPWTSPIIDRPESLSLVVEPEPIDVAQPGLPAGMPPPEIVPPRRYQTAAGLWVTPTLLGDVVENPATPPGQIWWLYSRSWEIVLPSSRARYLTSITS